jgi:ribose-phosphate pyrophosphokinase
MTAVVLQHFSHDRAQAQAVASRLGVECAGIGVHEFPDGEIRVTVAPPRATVIVHASLDRPNAKLIALLLAAEALRREGAARLVLVAPYLCYMRQDRAFQPGEAISQRAIGALLAAQFDRIVTVDAHLHRTPRLADVFPGIDSNNLSAMPAIAATLRAEGVDPQTLIAGPDQESAAWVRQLADPLGLPFAVARKTRSGDRAVTVEFPDLGPLQGRPVVLVDDLVSSGGTLVACARALMQAGAAHIDAVVTHALFPESAATAFAEAGIRSLRSTTSVAHSTNAIALDGLIAAALADEIIPSRDRRSEPCPSR